MAFTPRSGGEPKAFAGREKEFKFFEESIQDAENGTSNHFLVLGEWGLGKTVLLDKFKKGSQDKGFLAPKIVIRKFRMFFTKTLDSAMFSPDHLPDQFSVVVI